ncbi:MAG: nucleotidyl transferase AbiEii/AbiGii toxin family protein [Candidatus Margulisiibacteriota bacterium]
MLTLEQLQNYIPGDIYNKNKKAALVEYLQYEVLESIYKEKTAFQLCFIGGTAIRIIYNSARFSEDIDFDNFGLSFQEFDALLNKACKNMELKGFQIEIKIIEKGAYHCFIRFPEILYKAGITTNTREKILVKVDAEQKQKYYNPQRVLINKFGIYQNILSAPADVLLAQKIMTIIDRKREKGRDLYDVSFLLGLTRPNYKYLEDCYNLNEAEIKNKLVQRVKELDLEYLARDVEPFLFFPEQKQRVLSFDNYIKQVLG